MNNQKESGSNFKSAKLNDDQSVEITMSKSDYKQMMKEMKSNVEITFVDKEGNVVDTASYDATSFE